MKSGRRAKRGQVGMTMIELLLAVTISGLILVPMLGWAVMAIGQEASTRQRNVDAADQGFLRTYVLRDVASADAAYLAGPEFVDCTGGPGSGGTLLVALTKGTNRITYTVAAGSQPGTTGLWRRTCPSSGGAPTDTVETVRSVAAAGTAAECKANGSLPDSCQRLNVRVTAVDGRTTSVTVSVRNDAAASVSSPGGPTYVPPTVVLGASAVRAYRGEAVDFSSAGSADPAGGSLTYYWEFGDGTHSTDPSPAKSYPSLGSFTAILTVTNAAGTPATDYVVIEIKNRAPVAVIASPSDGLTAPIGQNLSFSATGSNDSGDAAFGGSIASYQWDFGDGGTSTSAAPSHTYSTPSPAGGHTTVHLTVTDNDGGTAQASIQLRITSPPTAVISSPAEGSTVYRGDAVDFSSSGSTDPDGTITTYLWNFGDGTTSGAANPSHTYAPSTTVGTRTVTLTVTDDDGFTASASMHVQVRNRSVTVSLAAAPASGRVNFSTTITPTISDPDSAVATYQWNLGNGTTATTAGPVTATYSVPTGTGDTFVSAPYTATLTLFDAGGAQLGSGSTVITATGAPAPTNFRKTSSRCVTNIIWCWERGISFAWNSVSNVNLYQIQLGSSSTYTFSGTSGEITGLNGSSSNYSAKIRARDTTTGKWGDWSPTIQVSS